MPKHETFHLHPTGWETDPPDEFFKLSTIDYLVGQVYTPFALFFKLPNENDDATKQRIVSALKHALERTLSQCRQLCGVLESRPDNIYELYFHKTRDSTVEFHVQYLDDTDSYPSFAQLESHHFVSAALGALHTWTVAPMTYGPKPETSPAHNPRASSFKASFIRGGLVLVMHNHHYANDAQGWAGSMHQLAENCAAIWRDPKAPDFPPWDPACLDTSRVTVPDVPADQQIDIPVPPSRSPDLAHSLDHKPRRKMLLFHLPNARAAELKRLASPADPSRWISSYDAFMAFTWRVLTRHRARVFGADRGATISWGETVNIRGRLGEPKAPDRAQGNWVWAVMSGLCKDVVSELTVGEVVDGVPLAELAWYIRRLTNTVTPTRITAASHAIAPIRDKLSLVRSTDTSSINSYASPGTAFVSDWRGTRACEADFGFARPVAFRMLMDVVTPGMVLVYPARKGGEDEEEAGAGAGKEGVEISVAVEREIVGGLLGDEEWGGFFEFRGVDVEE